MSVPQARVLPDITVMRYAILEQSEEKEEAL
jgi:hypothetical protein